MGVNIIADQKWKCPRHGEQAVIGVQLTLDTPKRKIDKRYCLECWIELMDRTCGELTEVK